MIYKATELYEKLISEHDEGHYFRGQNREYDGPLWPSNYRQMFRSTDCLTIEDDSRLRMMGKRFYFRMNAFDWQLFKTEKEYTDFFMQQQLKQFIMAHTRNALGYPLSEAFFQQTGMRSEGLDVTSDVRIAFFFAIYEWGPKGYQLRQNSKDPCVIYRWLCDNTISTLDTLNQYDFYSCPQLIPVRELLTQFERCGTVGEFKQSIEEYQNAINWGPFFDLDEILGKRPFHLIKLPDTLVQNCRVVQQHAALLIPDAVISQEFLRRHTVTSPQLIEELQNGMFVEDLGQSPTCEKFYFDLADVKKIDWLMQISPDTMFPHDDLLFNLLRGWMRTFIQNPYGTLPVFPNMPKGVDYGEFLQYLLSDYETKFFI